jgi:hypothetical protein
MKSDPRYVYFMKPVGMDGPIKIGNSNAPLNRLEGLAAWSPWPLELIGTVPGNFSDESFLHRCFADLHSHREWFRHSEQLATTIASIVAAGSVDAVRGSLQPCGSIRPRRKAGWTPEVRRYASYSHRVRHAEKRLREHLGDDGAWHTPDDVRTILYDWMLSRGDAEGAPTPDNLARLDEFLADPSATSIIPQWRLKKAAA